MLIQSINFTICAYSLPPRPTLYVHENCARCPFGAFCCEAEIGAFFFFAFLKLRSTCCCLSLKKLGLAPSFIIERPYLSPNIGGGKWLLKDVFEETSNFVQLTSTPSRRRCGRQKLDSISASKLVQSQLQKISIFSLDCPSFETAETSILGCFDRSSDQNNSKAQNAKTLFVTLLAMGLYKKAMESQTRISKPALREFRNWRVRKSANPSPTLRQLFANLSPTLCQPFLPTPLQPPLSVDPRHPFRDTG